MLGSRTILKLGSRSTQSISHHKPGGPLVRKTTFYAKGESARYLRRPQVHRLKAPRIPAGPRRLSSIFGKLG